MGSKSVLSVTTSIKYEEERTLLTPNSAHSFNIVMMRSWQCDEVLGQVHFRNMQICDVVCKALMSYEVESVLAEFAWISETNCNVTERLAATSSYC